MRVWDLAQGQTAGPSPMKGVMDMDSSWAHHPASAGFSSRDHPASLRKNPLICKRLVPAVNVVEHGCYGNACSDDVKSPPDWMRTCTGIL